MFFTNLLRKFFALMFAFIPLIMNNHETPAKQNFVEPVSTQTFSLADGLLRGQGMTTNGKSYYFSSLFAIIKTGLDCETVEAQNLVAIPCDLLRLGCDHIGGISYYNGKIYAPIEGGENHEYIYLCTFDSETLKLIDCYEMSAEYHVDGIPWCIADSENGVLYTPQDINTDLFNMFDLETMEFRGNFQVSFELLKVQGGEIYNGIMYLATSRSTQPVYAVNLKTGEAQVIFERNLFDESEGEGLTILKTDDGAFFHILDVASVRLGTHVRHYAFNPDSIVWTQS